MKVSEATARIIGTIIAVLAYVCLDTLVNGQVLATGPLLKAIGLRTVELSALLMFADWLAIWLWSRKIRGKWAYYSEAGHFGLADIKLIKGEFQYSVELFKTAGEVAACFDGESDGTPFAHVTSQMSRYDHNNQQFFTDYHINYTDPSYPQRSGILTLIHSTNDEVMVGYWHTMLQGTPLRTGRLDFHRKHSFVKKYLAHPNAATAQFSTSLPVTPPDGQSSQKSAAPLHRRATMFLYLLHPPTVNSVGV